MPNLAPRKLLIWFTSSAWGVDKINAPSPPQTRDTKPRKDIGSQFGQLGSCLSLLVLLGGFGVRNATVGFQCLASGILLFEIV